MTTYDKWGFDEDGFNKDGFNKFGFDRNGYNKLGFDIHGYNRQGIYQKTNRDRDGYDIEGYDMDGYDRDGYDKEGYDRSGYNKNGYDVNGYDQDGFNQQGFNAKGYDREGYNKDGYNVNGYNRAGYDKWGFDRAGYDCDGYDIYGFNEKGFNFFGFDRFGFNEEGIHREGFAKIDFDEEGYHLFTGFNLQGYDREGFNINGYNNQGYDRDGFDIDGYNQAGYDRNGYNKKGFNKNGFDINGYDINGYDVQGYNIDGFDKRGYDRDGFDIDGYNEEGYDRFDNDRNGKKKTYSIHDLKPGMSVYHKKLGQGKIIRFEDDKKYIVLQFPFEKELKTYAFPKAFGKYLEIEKPLSLKQREESYVLSEDERERKWYSNLMEYLRHHYLPQQIKIAENGYRPHNISIIGKDFFLETKDIGPGIDQVRKSVNDSVSKLIKNPYFAHIDYFEDENLYIGKKAIPGYVTDWADKRASLFYEYQMYIGIADDIELKLVREIDFGGGKYIGYRDLYNSRKAGSGKDVVYADERLSRIIKLNQENKKIHDIIETIQQNQYEIITQDKEENILVIGCAGSGKTMVLMHRIRFMKFNNPDLNMHNIMVLSPTDILGRESKELSRILDVSSVQQSTMTDFYYNIVDKIITECFKVENLVKKVELDDSIPEKIYYNQKFLDDCIKRIKKYLNLQTLESKTYLKEKTEKLKLNRKVIHDKYGGYKIFQQKHGLYKRTIKELEKYTEEDLLVVIKYCNDIKIKIEKIKTNIKLTELVYTQAGFKSSADLKDGNEKKTDNRFDSVYFTNLLAKKIDLNEVYRFVKKNNIICGSISRFIQLLCAFPNENQAINKELLFAVRNELEKYSERDFDSYIKEMEQQIHTLENLPRTADMLNAILSEKQINKGKTSNFSEHDIVRIGSEVQNLLNEMNWEEGESLPFSDFEMYENLQEQSKRLIKFEKGEEKWCFLQDTICDLLHISNDTGTYSLNESKLFAMAYILQNISNYSIDDDRIVFLDEFQDFSNVELKFLRKIISKGAFNLFGDYAQCINPKGINSKKLFKHRKAFNKTYVINENYRNAKEITEYVNKRFGMNMMAIGLEGKVDLCEKPVPIRLEKGDRGAIIISDSVDSDIELKGTNTIKFERDGVIHPDAYNIIPVSMTKGLEFEKVIAITHGMTDNQKYVAFTRAINYLQIVE